MQSIRLVFAVMVLLGIGIVSLDAINAERGLDGAAGIRDRSFDYYKVPKDGFH